MAKKKYSKKNCQIFTPRNIAQKLLDIIEYKEDVYGKKIIENSCGDGNILFEIVSIYIITGMKQKYSIEKIKEGLENDIYGYEINKRHLDNCIRRLNNLCEKYDIEDVRWNVYCDDFLKKNIQQQFDYVVGNPPYITYNDLTISNRKYCKKTFEVCKHGRFDYYYAFIEAGIKSLSEQGKMIYLIPNNFFKNEFAMELRKYILPHLVEVVDFDNQIIFSSRQVSSTMILLKNECNENSIKYENIFLNKKKEIAKNSLHNKWLFCDTNVIKNCHLFGEYFHAASAVATLCNKAFVLKDGSFIGDYYVTVAGDEIEKSIIKPASFPRYENTDKNIYIIYPYQNNTTTIGHFSEDEMKKTYPKTYLYLKKSYNVLKKRESDNAAKWYEYGRSQALTSVLKEKIILSTIVTDKVLSYIVEKDKIPVSGIYIISRYSSIYLETAQKILESREFNQYVKKIGIITGKDSIRISAKNINEFQFNPQDYGLKDLKCGDKLWKN